MNYILKYKGNKNMAEGRVLSLLNRDTKTFYPKKPLLQQEPFQGLFKVEIVLYSQKKYEKIGMELMVLMKVGLI